MISPTFITFTLAASLLLSVRADSAGYVLPSSGTASTTQFSLGSELGSGTACGMNSLPNGATSTSGTTGSPANGPGYLYAAINQLAFGANPSAGAGGPGGACGICYQITPVSASGTALTAQALTFRIIDECPASVALSGGSHCGQCSTSAVNDYGQTWHFDIAADAMSSDQYNTFFNGVTDGSNWKEVEFTQVGCDDTLNGAGGYTSWGCAGGCQNNEAASVCQGV